MTHAPSGSSESATPADSSPGRSVALGPRAAERGILLLLEGRDGRVARSLRWAGEPGARLIRARKTGRLEVAASLAELRRGRAEFDDLGELTEERLRSGPIGLQNGFCLRVAGAAPEIARDPSVEKRRDRPFALAAAAVAGLALALGCLLAWALRSSGGALSAAQPPVQTHIVDVRKPQLVPPAPEPRAETNAPDSPRDKETNRASALKRLGALAVLGQLSKNRSKGGLDVGAARATAGAGLGGEAGSGGAQASMYGPGLVGAPVGPGANLQGGGGYGTKGKGGGQAGYGELRLTGGAGAAHVPLGRAQSVSSGLSKESIEAAIAKHLGEVRFCYEQGLQAEPGLAGRVAVAFVIGTSGRVSSAAVDSTTVHAQVVESCIVERLKGWGFPTPAGGVEVRVSYPFVLRRMGQG